jgi:phosphatidylinositol alpha-1,6-mannosyltransferase
MKILFISHTFPPIVGGVETQNYELSLWLPKYAEVQLIANKKRWLLPFFLLYAPIRALLLSKNYDVLLLGSGIMGNAGWLVKKITKKPVVIIAHGLDLTWKNKLYQKLWVKNFIPSADKIIAVGNETVSVGVEHGIPVEKFIFIPNGVDTEKHLVPGSTRADLEKIIGQSVENKKVIMTSGRLAKRKGVAWFIRNVMPKLGNEFIYVIAGSGPDKQNIEQAIKENNLEKSVITLGYIPDVDRNVLWCTADLFIQPNIKVSGDMEGFGISVIEAGACRLPVLASNIEGLKDAIKDCCNGFLIESENPEAFVQKINELFADGSPCDIFGQQVRDYVIENYSWEKIAQQYMEEIKKTVAEISHQ